jgi:hypothetical protein
MVASIVAAKAMTIISFCMFPSLSRRLAKSMKFIVAGKNENLGNATT